MKSWTKKDETRKEITKILDGLNWKLLKFYAEAYAKYIPINGMTYGLDQIASSIYHEIGKELTTCFADNGLEEYGDSDNPFHDCDFWTLPNPTAHVRRYLYYTLCEKVDRKEERKLHELIQPKFNYFWENIDKAKECWIWKKNIDGSGYYQKVSKDEMVNYFHDTKNEDFLNTTIDVNGWGMLFKNNNDYDVDGTQF